MREFKAFVTLDENDKIVRIEPVKQAEGREARVSKMTVRVLSQGEVDKESEECMTEGCHTYRRKNNRMVQTR